MTDTDIHALAERIEAAVFGIIGTNDIGPRPTPEQRRIRVGKESLATARDDRAAIDAACQRLRTEGVSPPEAARWARVEWIAGVLGGALDGAGGGP